MRPQKIALILMTAILHVSLPSLAQNDEINSTKCADWSKAISFEEATREFIKTATQNPADFGCLSRSSWMAVEDLFRPENHHLYESRLKAFADTMRMRRENPLLTQKAFEDLQILFQLRWLRNNYEGMKNYKSSKVIGNVAMGTAGILVLGGAALFTHNKSLLTLRETVRPALLRMIVYLGTALYSRSDETTDSDKSADPKQMNAQKVIPPIDVIGKKTYWNYSDLHLMRDLASVTANALATGAAHAAATAMAMKIIAKFVGTAKTASGILSGSSVAGFVVAYPVGKLAGVLTEKAITDKYHKLHLEETAVATNKLKSNQMSDWQAFVLAAQLTQSSLTWVSTQDMYLQSNIENSIKDFYHLNQARVCTRIHQESQPKLVRNLSSQPKQNQLPIEGETQLRFDDLFKRDESKLRTKIYFLIEDKRRRLLDVRQGILQRLLAIERMHKSQMGDFVIQHQVLLDRLDQYLNHDEMIPEDIGLLGEQVAHLAPDSSRWKDSHYVETLRELHQCRR